MRTIGTPLTIPELDLKPEQTGGIELTESMQQVLALLTGYWRNKRVLLKASPSGILYVTGPQIAGIFGVSALGDSYDWVGDKIECSEVMVMGHPNNTALIWAQINGVASSGTSWAIAKGEVLGLGLLNMSMLNLNIELDAERAIIAYSI